MDDRYSRQAEDELEYDIHYQALVKFVDLCMSNHPDGWHEIWMDIRREAYMSVRKMKALFNDRRGA